MGGGCCWWSRRLGAAAAAVDAMENGNERIEKYKRTNAMTAPYIWMDSKYSWISEQHIDRPSIDCNEKVYEDNERERKNQKRDMDG